MTLAVRDDPRFKLDAMQIENILDRLVPLIAAPEDQGFFRGVLQIKAETNTSGHFAYFVSQLLKAAGKDNEDFPELQQPTS